MDPLVLAILAAVLANIGTIIGLFLWSTNNANEFRKEASTALEEHRKETNAILRSIAEEMKDFHGRLIRIEEARK